MVEYPLTQADEEAQRVLEDNSQDKTSFPMEEQTPNTTTSSAKRRRKKKSNQLMLSRKGEKRSLQDWTMLDAETLFPHLGEQTYRVPPVYFNRQNVVLQDEHNIYVTPTGSAVNGCIAHDVVKLDDSVADTEPSGDSLSDEEAQESADKGYTNGYTLDSCNQSPGKKRKLAVLREVCENGCGEAIGCEDKVSRDVSSNNLKQTSPQEKECGQTQSHPELGRQEKVRVLVPPQESQVRRDKALSRVLDTMEYLSRQLQQQHQKPLFIVSSISYDNYLSRLPARTAASFKVPRPQDVAKRGQLDILILHERAGVILVQVKAVGDNLASWNATPADAEQAIARMVDRAVNQLDRDQKVFNHVLKDLDPIPPFSRVVALPFVDRQALEKVRHLGQVTWEDVKFLCQDDIEACAGECCLLSRVKHIPEFCQEHAAHDDAKLLLTWWRHTFDLDTTRLSVQQQKMVVGRVCGLLSSLQVQNISKMRVEVRTYGQAVSETAARATSSFLTPDHSQVLRRRDDFLILAGPPGAGKTMLLTLKARQWLVAGRFVVVLNMGRQESGFPRAYTLQKAVNCDLPNGTLKAARMNIGLCNISLEMLEQTVGTELARLTEDLMISLQTESSFSKEYAVKLKDDIERGRGYICFIVDEVLPDLEKFVRVRKLLEVISGRPETRCVWWGTTGLVEEGAWQKYSLVTMKSVLRLPPAVQSLLQRLEWRDPWKAVYSTSSADAGLPTDGPPAIFLHHKHHLQSPSSNTSSCPPPDSCSTEHILKPEETRDVTNAVASTTVSLKGPLQCSQCAEDVARFLKSLLQESEIPDFPTLLTSRRTNSAGVKDHSPGKIEFKDILLLTAIPRSCHGGQQRAFLREKEEAFWSAIRSCNFVRSFQDLGIPVQVERDEQSQEIAVGSGEKVVFTDVKVARGLERKVVVFIPLFSDDPLAPLAGDMSACTDNIQPSVQETANGANHSGSDDVRADSSGRKTHQRTAEEQFSPNTSFVAVMSRDSGDEKVRARQAADTLAVIKTDATSKRCSPLPWCIDALVSELDEATRKGLYTAASCCVSQLFVVVPDPFFLSK